MGKKKAQSTVKGKAGSKGKLKLKHTDLEGSYLSPQRTTSDAMNTGQGILTASPSYQSDLMTMLHRIEQSNKDLAQRVEKMEKQNAPVVCASSPVTQVRRDGSAQNALATMNPYLGGPAGQQGHPRITDAVGWRQQAQGVEQDGSVIQQTGAGSRPDPTLEAVRSSSDVSRAVTHLLAYYDEQAETEVMQGKGPFGRRKSGRYNVTDTTNVKPEFKWPNEGYITNSSAKKPAYDDMNMAQWVAGQLHNISQVDDLTLVKMMLQQVILSVRDAVAIPWAAVRAAWGVSMTQLEEGRLHWSDQTQWSLNRINSSQVAVLNGQAVSNVSNKSRLCKFFNEGSCSHESHHGVYRHFCSSCFKNGRSLTHPEVKCSVKSSFKPHENAAPLR